MIGYLGDAPHIGPYHTGDKVQCLPSGEFLFCGRLDRQVKVRGHRIELAEVEHACLKADGVIAAVAIPRESNGVTVRLEAFVCPGDVDPEEVLRVCREHLPAPAIPQRVTPLDSMPRTSNGKVDRERLATQRPKSC